MSNEGRERALSIDWRGDEVCGAMIEGMDMAGTAIEEGCSNTTDDAGGDTGVLSTDGRGDGSAFASSAFGSSGLLSSGISGAVSDVLESMLVLATSLAGLFRAGLSGRDPSSEDGLDSAPSFPLLTAFASRSCNRELGLLREELRDTGTVSTCFLSPSEPRTLIDLQALLLSGFHLGRRLGSPRLRARLIIVGQDAIQPRLEARHSAA